MRLLLLFAVLLAVVSCSDFRCKCVCNKNATRQIFIKTGMGFESCVCGNVVPKEWMGSCSEELCECNYDIRNSNVIQVSVSIGIACIILLLVFVGMDMFVWKFVAMPRFIFKWKQSNIAQRNRVYVNRIMLH